MKRFLVFLSLFVMLPTQVAFGSPGLSTDRVTSTMRIGFNVNGPTDQDLATLRATGTAGVIANFCCPLDTSQDRPGLLNIRILRHTNGCPTFFGYACSSPSTSELAAFATAHPGQTYELGNEPGNGGQDGLTGLVAWVKLGGMTIKGADPTATVLGPGWLNWSSRAATNYTNFIKSVDGVAFHLYPSNLCLGASWFSSVKSTINSATSYAAAHGKTVYMTEMSDDNGCSGTGANRTSYVSQVKAYLAGKNVVALVWFTERFLSGYPTGYLIKVDGTPTYEGLGLSN